MTDRKEIDGIPVILPLPEDDYKPIVPDPCDPNPIVAICGQCGLRISRVMGYVCPHNRCPCGFGGPRA